MWAIVPGWVAAVTGGAVVADGTAAAAAAPRASPLMRLVQWLRWLCTAPRDRPVVPEV